MMMNYTLSQQRWLHHVRKNGPRQQILQVATTDSNITPREFMDLSLEHSVFVIVVQDADPTMAHTPYKYVMMAQTIATHKLTFFL